MALGGAEIFVLALFFLGDPVRRTAMTSPIPSKCRETREKTEEKPQYPLVI